MCSWSKKRDGPSHTSDRSYTLVYTPKCMHWDLCSLVVMLRTSVCSLLSCLGHQSSMFSLLNRFRVQVWSVNPYRNRVVILLLRVFRSFQMVRIIIDMLKHTLLRCHNDCSNGHSSKRKCWCQLMGVVRGKGNPDRQCSRRCWESLLIGNQWTIRQNLLLPILGCSWCFGKQTSSIVGRWRWLENICQNLPTKIVCCVDISR